jgi:four helix bundle protein
LRVKHLQTADAYLQLVKTQIKFAKRRKYISKGFYSTIDESMTEIGKMMTGYIKASSKK